MRTVGSGVTSSPLKSNVYFIPFGFQHLFVQCKTVGVRKLHLSEAIAALENPSGPNSYDLVVDSLFGFSFRAPSREPFTALLASLRNAARKGQFMLAVDVPSGRTAMGARTNSLQSIIFDSLFFENYIFQWASGSQSCSEEQGLSSICAIASDYDLFWSFSGSVDDGPPDTYP